jgi:hypothetical protein
MASSEGRNLVMEAGATTKRLVLKSQVKIDCSRPGVCRVGDVDLPSEIFSDTATLELAPSWHLEKALRTSKARSGVLHCRISSDDPSKEAFLLPAGFFLWWDVRA